MSLIQLIKQASIEAVEQSSPMSIAYGTVTEINPLKIVTDQETPLTEKVLILTSNVIDQEVKIEVNDSIKEALISPYTHTHEYTGIKKHIHKKSLEVGEKVLLLRVDGGQKYIILDRL